MLVFIAFLSSLLNFRLKLKLNDKPASTKKIFLLPKSVKYLAFKSKFNLRIGILNPKVVEQNKISLMLNIDFGGLANIPILKFKHLPIKKLN